MIVTDDLLADWLPGTWFNWSIIPAKREPTEEEKTVHRAISFDHGDGKRYGHRDYTGVDE